MHKVAALAIASMEQNGVIPRKASDINTAKERHNIDKKD